MSSSKPMEFENPSYNPGYNVSSAPPPPYSAQDGQAAPIPLIVSRPPPQTGMGLFLNEDQPVLLQPTIGPGGRVATALDFLKSASTLIVKQKIELIEILTSFDTQNRFTIYNERGQVVFYAVEESDCLVRHCCGPARPFDLRIFDIQQNEIIHINRPLACQACCCFCCLMNVEVTSPPGTVVGHVQQEWSIIFPKFSIRNAVGETVLTIDGPFCRLSCGGDIEFKVMSLDGKTQVGKVSKTWSGFAQEFFTDADNFNVSFPQDLDLDVKAALLGACFLIDVMYFEKKK